MVNPRYMPRLLVAVLLGITGGCASVASQPPPDLPEDLLSGAALFDSPVGADEAPVIPILEPDEQMRDFVGDISEGRLAVVRFNRLLSRLDESGFFSNKYDASVTLTAAKTFETKVGNCISYTNLFVSLARLANLEVRYQIVPAMHPTWDASEGTLIKNNHINVVVIGARFQRNRSSGLTIDFNEVQSDDYARGRLVSDEYAASLFYANLAMDAMLAGEARQAFALLRHAIALEPRNSDLWINLGAIYNRYGEYELAIRSLKIAQELDPHEKIVLSSLERSYRGLGDIDRADKLAAQVRRHRLQNPYYQFALAQRALKAGDLAESRIAIDRAVRMRKREPRFLYLKSRVYRDLGETDIADASLERARRYAEKKNTRGYEPDLFSRRG